jgi:hypothetical protein
MTAAEIFLASTLLFLIVVLIWTRGRAIEATPLPAALVGRATNSKAAGTNRDGFALSPIRAVKRHRAGVEPRGDLVLWSDQGEYNARVNAPSRYVLDRNRSAKLLTKDETRRIAANVAKLPNLLPR